MSRQSDIGRITVDDLLRAVAVRPEGAFAERLTRAIRGAIIAGRLQSGWLLPSSRALAPRIGIARGTVQAAYEQLIADGWLEAHAGKGSFVAMARRDVERPLPPASTVAAHTVSEDDLFRVDLSFAAVLRGLADHVPAEDLAIAMVEKGEFRVVAASGRCSVLLGASVPPGLGLLERGGEPTGIRSAFPYASDPRAIPALLSQGIQAVVAAPIVVEGKTVGCVSLCSTAATRFDRRTEQLIEEAARELGHHAVTVRPLQRHLERMRMLRDRLLGLRDEDSLCEEIATLVAELAPTMTLWLSRYAEDGTPVVACAVHAGRVVRDLEMRTEGMIVALPLTHGAERVGALLVPSSTSDADVEVVRDMARIAGSALAEIRTQGREHLPWPADPHLRASREAAFFERAFEDAADAILAVDEAGSIRLVNEAAERLFGYPRAELVGRSVEVLVPERAREAHVDQRTTFMHGPRTRPMGLGINLHGRRRDGTEFPADINLSVITTPQQRLVCATVRDVSELQRMERTFSALHAIAFASRATLDASEIATFAVERARSLLAVDAVALHWWSEQSAALEMLARVGPPTPAPIDRIELGDEVQGLAFQQRRPVVLDDYAASSVRREAHSIFQSAVAVPVLRGERAMGTLFAASVTARHWHSDDVRALTVLASQVGPAIEAGRLVEELDRQRGLYASLLTAQADLGQATVLLRDERVVYANAAFAELVGRDAQDIRDLGDALGLVVPEEREVAAARWAAAQASHQRFQVRLRRGDGALRRFEVALAPVPSVGSVSVIALAHDVTEQAAAAERFERAFRSNPAGLVISRSDTSVIVDVNDRFCRLLGYDRDEIVGHSAPELGIFADPAERSALFEQFRAEGAVRDREITLRTRQGDLVQGVTSMEPLEVGGAPHILGAVIDITERKRAQAELERLALHDPLTGLPNRALFRDRVGQAVAAAARQSASFALLHLDLDAFKEVNDAFGHEAGDEVLRGVGERLSGALRRPDTVARFGADEFAVVLPDARSREAAAVIARRLLDAVVEPFGVSDRQVTVGASVGIVRWPDDGGDADELLRHADIAMHAAKHSGSGYAFYASQQDPRSEARLELRADLRRAVERGELSLEFQPIVDLRSGVCVRTEALARWRHPRRGLIPPEEFVAFAEETGVIRPLGLWVLEEAVRRCGQWRAEGFDIGVAANLSARSLLDPALIPRVRELLVQWDVPADALTLEITESAVMSDPDRSLAALAALREIGVRLSVDDFGTGYSSLAYLQRLPVSEVKIDRSFIGRLTTDQNSAAIVRSVVELGHTLSLEVTAEGVEDQATRAGLAALGCDLAQGFLIARPMAYEAVRDWLGGDVRT